MQLSIPDNEKTTVYAVGDTVEKDGCYVCSPCGERKQFKKGTIFPRCLACLSRKERQDFFRDEELWEPCG